MSGSAAPVSEWERRARFLTLTLGASAILAGALLFVLFWHYLVLAGLGYAGWRLFKTQVLGHRPRARSKSALEIVVAAIVGYLAGERRKQSYFERKAATRKWTRISADQRFAQVAAGEIDYGDCPFLDD